MTFPGNMMNDPEACSERVVGRAGSLCGDCITVYRGDGFKMNPIVVRFHNRDDQWAFYCTDVDIVVDAHGFAVMSESSCKEFPNG